jgi:hypothetical protein
MFGWGWAGVGPRIKYNQLSIKGNEAYHAACHDQESFDMVMECFSKVIAKNHAKEPND